METPEAPTPPGQAAADSSGGAKQKTCFVVIGFGRKTDFATGRVLDLDKTYEQLIRPAFDEVNINCFRAIDANLTGSIDEIMYEWLYEADFVLADLSTLNANVFYELGVRHAQKPNTTIIIAEQVLMQKIPFDLSSFVIHSYAHDGESIPEAERKSFVEKLSGIARKILDEEAQRQAKADAGERRGDSPVYTFLPGMTPPNYQRKVSLLPPPYVPREQRADAKPKEGESLAGVIDAAEAAKKKEIFPEAIVLFKQALEKTLEKTDKSHGDKKPDIFLAQRLALVTYKNGEERKGEARNDEKAVRALQEAEAILEKYCAPAISTDPETLGLSGAINKRLFERTQNQIYLGKSIAFYERGFYVKQDYYNGINAAFLHTIRANLLADLSAAVVSYGHANLMRKRVAEICEALIKDDASFQSRGDKEWVWTTLAEAYFGLGNTDEVGRYELKIQSIYDFAKKTYFEQKEKLKDAMEAFERRGITVGVKTSDTTEEAKPGGEYGVENKAPKPELAAPRPQLSQGREPITIFADIAKDKAIKSVEVNCRIEYD